MTGGAVGDWLMGLALNWGILIKMVARGFIM